jgi:hypothetical protein
MLKIICQTADSLEFKLQFENVCAQNIICCNKKAPILLLSGLFSFLNMIYFFNLSLSSFTICFASPTTPKSAT